MIPQDMRHTYRMRTVLHLTTLVLLGACARAVATAPAGPSPSAPVRLATVDSIVVASPRAVGFDAALPARLDSIVRIGIAEGAAPGAALAVARYGRRYRVPAVNPQRVVLEIAVDRVLGRG